MKAQPEIKEKIKIKSKHFEWTQMKSIDVIKRKQLQTITKTYDKKHLIRISIIYLFIFDKLIYFFYF